MPCLKKKVYGVLVTLSKHLSTFRKTNKPKHQKCKQPTGKPEKYIYNLEQAALST